jgi:hypothetical protein
MIISNNDGTNSLAEIQNSEYHTIAGHSRGSVTLTHPTVAPAGYTHLTVTTQPLFGFPSSHFPDDDLQFVKQCSGPQVKYDSRFIYWRG